MSVRMLVGYPQPSGRTVSESWLQLFDPKRKLYAGALTGPVQERKAVAGVDTIEVKNWSTAMMTSKRQSNDKAWRGGRSEPNLGQKAAELEKASEEQLSHMKGREATSAPGRFVAWCKQEQASIQQQLELMRTGKVLTGENRGSGWVDTTGESIERAKARLEELDSLLTETGSATVSKP
jgi:hypothetical protein